jgi:hypothetical protein
MFSDKNVNLPSTFRFSTKRIHDLKDLPYENYKLEQQFVTDITPFLVDKQELRPIRTVQEEKLKADIAYKKLQN